MSSTPTSSLVAPGKMLGGTHYILNGPEDGDLVVCVHGIGSFYEYFTGLSELLVGAGFRVLTYDLIGRGFSDQPSDDIKGDDPSPFGGTGHVKQLRALIEGLGLAGTRYHVIGHSMGGAIATMYAAQNYKEIKSLVVLSPAGLMDVGVINAVRRAGVFQGIISWSLKFNMESAWKNDFYDRRCQAATDMQAKLRVMYNHNPLSFNSFWQSVLHFPFNGIEPSIQVLEKQQVPVYVLWGKHDTAVPMRPSYERWRNILATNPRFECHVYGHLGHGFFLEDPDHCNPMIRDFIDKYRGEAK